MELNVRVRGAVHVIQLRGAVRLGDPVDRFRGAVDEAFGAGEPYVVVNLSEVPMIDSSGIGVLVKALTSAKQRGGTVKLVNPSKFAMQILRLIGVVDLFEIFEDEETALQSFA